MGTRLELQTVLEGLVPNVYFQPPANLVLKYPCVVYQRDYSNTMHADNVPYHRTKRYMVTVIDRNPDSVYPDKIASLPMCLFDRFYISDNLNHDSFVLYF